MLNRIIMFAFVTALLTSTASVRAQGSREEAAAKAALAWLALVDAGKYADSWTESAPLFKGAITSERWDQTLRGVRVPLGAVVNRAEASKTLATSLPGAPDGTYVVIQFTTEFANKKQASEVVTPMLTPGGVWRVSGYYIR